MQNNLVDSAIKVRPKRKSKVKFLIWSEIMAGIVKVNLLTAVEQADFEEVQRIIEFHKKHYERIQEEGFDLICTAIQRKHTDIAKLLISEGFKISSETQMNTALHVAVVYGDLETIDLLVRKGISVFSEDSELMTPFFLIAKRIPKEETREILQYFLRKGVKVNSQHRMNHFTLTHFAAKFGNDDLIRLLKKKKFPLNNQAKGGLTPLHIAVTRGQINVVSTLLKFVRNFETRDARGWTPLRLAVEINDISAIHLILDYTLRLRKNNFKKKYGTFLLYCAAASGDKKKTEFLIDKGAKINAYVFLMRNTPLHIAVENEFSEIVQLLLERGADRRAKQLPNCNNNNYLSLHIATLKGNLSICQQLLKHGAQFSNKHMMTIFNPGFHDLTSLHIATQMGYSEIEQLFLNKGAVLFSKKKNQLRLLALLAQYGPLDMLQICLHQYRLRNHDILNEKTIQSLLVLAAQANDPEILRVFCKEILKTHNKILAYLALYSAVFYGKEDIAMSLIMKSRVDPYYHPKGCLPVLHAAAQKGRIQIFKDLLGYYMEINFQSHSSSLLHAAISYGNDEMVELLLYRGTDVNAKLKPIPEIVGYPKTSIFIIGEYINFDVGVNGLKVEDTPLHFAAEKGRTTIVNKLLKWEADIDATSRNGSTSLMLAVQNDHTDVVFSLLRAGANIQVQKHLTPLLSRAISNKNPPIVKLLVEYYAPVNIVLPHYSSNIVRASFTPLHIAISDGDAEIIEILLKAGALVDFETEQDLPLHHAIEVGNEDMIIKLIKYGASFETTCSKRISPFFHALKANRLDNLRFMLSKGVPFENVTEKGESLLSYIVKNELRKPMVRFLATYGIIEFERKRNPENSILYDILREKIVKIKKPSMNRPRKRKNFVKGETYYREKQRNWLLRIMLEAGCDANTWSQEEEESILHIAVRDQRANAVDTLLKYGADVSVEDSDGYTAFLYAVSQAARSPNFKWENMRDLANHKNLGQLEIIIRSLIAAIALQIATHKRVNQGNKNLFINQPFLYSYFRYCIAELKKLKATSIDNINFLKLFEVNETKLVKYSRNIEVQEKILPGISKQFPIYGENLRFRVQCGVEKAQLLNDKTVFFSKMKVPGLPLEIRERILQHLTPHELRIMDHLCD